MFMVPLFDILLFITLISETCQNKTIYSYKAHDPYWNVHSNVTQSVSTQSNDGTAEPLIRRKWPDIKFEDFYRYSGDGPIDENMTSSLVEESYSWMTIVTETKASLWPTITRVRLSPSMHSSPHPSKVVSTNFPLTPSRSFLSDQFSIDYSHISILIDSSDLLETILSRNSYIYPGPSSTLMSSLSALISEPLPSFGDSQYSSIMSNNDVITSTLNISSSYITIDLESSPFTSSPFTSEPIQLSNFITPLTSSFPIDSTLTTPIQSIDESQIPSSPSLISVLTPTFSMSDILTPIHSISLTSLSSPKTLTPPLSSIEDIRSITAVTHSHQSIIPTPSQTPSLTPTLAVPTSTVQPSSTVQLSSTARPSSTPVPTQTQTPTPSSKPLCPEVTEVIKPEGIDAVPDDLLIRTGTVLNKKNLTEESIINYTINVGGKLREIYVHAYGKQLEKHGRYERKLLQALDQNTNPNVTVKIWNINTNNSSDEMHIIYSVEQNGKILPYEDVSRTFGHISDEKFSEMIGLSVISKTEPYLKSKHEPIVAKSDNSLLSFILLLCSVGLFIICVIASAIIYTKYRSEKRKWLNSFQMELNRVAPENVVRWKTVSQSIEPSTSVKTLDKSEFQYVPFKSDDKSLTKKKKMTSKGVQSTVESHVQIMKEKVIPIAEITTDELDNDNGINGLSRTYVTTKEIETNQSIDTIPRIIQVQMSEQTQSIIRAIRNELKRFSGPSSPPAEESIISNSSEA